MTATTKPTTTTVAHLFTARVPALALDPRLGPPGTLVAVTGHGFPKDRLADDILVGFDSARW